jgi:thiamine biosynthesis lipoprotein
MMGTFVEVKVAVPDHRVEQAQEAVERAKEQMQAFIEVVSSWDSNSDTSRINANAGKAPTRVDARLMRVLLRAQQISEMSGGAFDITFSPVGRLWNLRATEPVIPHEKAIASAFKLVGYKDLVLDPEAGTAFLRREGMRIDLGGIAKGAVIDVAARSLKASGFQNALISAGGDLYAMGAKGNEPWMVGITDPHNPRGPVIGKVPLTDRAIATSGDYEKMVEIAGKRYHHIIDPRTGQLAGKCISATVISSDAETADALSTAFFVLGPKAGIALCERLENIEAVLIDTDFNVVSSSGFPRIIERNKPK